MATSEAPDSEVDGASTSAFEDSLTETDGMSERSSGATRASGSYDRRRGNSLHKPNLFATVQKVSHTMRVTQVTVGNGCDCSGG